MFRDAGGANDARPGRFRYALAGLLLGFLAAACGGLLGVDFDDVRPEEGALPAKCAAPCPLGLVCNRGSCQASCDPDLFQCGADCVDTSRDPANCGTCFRTCLSTAGDLRGQRCIAGACVDGCGEGETPCATGCCAAGGGSEVEELAVGGAHGCAILRGGELRCWGRGEEGQIGDGETRDRATAVVATKAAPGIVTIAAGSRHTCAGDRGASLRCWGLASSGQLGEPALLVDFVRIWAGSDHNCGANASGEIRCWGAGASGRLGTGSGISSSQPNPVQNLGAGVRDVALGHEHSCAITAQGKVVCWGSNTFGALGDGTTSNASSLPVDVVGLKRAAISLAAADFFTCAVLDDATVQCWGHNASGQLGIPSSLGTSKNEAVSVPNLSDVEEIAAGGDAVDGSHTCARLTDGQVKCWGANLDGQAGIGAKSLSVDLPTAVVGLPGPATKIALGPGFSCAVSGGAVYCWGSGDRGRLGSGSTANSTRAERVVGL